MSFSLTVLVFVGTASFAAFVLVTLYRTLQEGVENRDDDAVVLSPMRRFISPEKLLAVRFVSCMVCAVVGVLVFIANDILSPFAYLPFAAALGALGWKLPRIWFAIKVRKRKELFDSQILTLTMSLANGLRSGQALPQALDAAAKRMPPPMQEELVQVLNETHLGLELSEALERMYIRMPGEDLRLLLTSVRLTLQAGGSLADVLGRMVEMIRARSEFQEKLKTMTSKGRFEAIAMSLAPLFVYILLRLIDPELMKPLTSTVIGWCTIGCVMVMLTIGYFVINKIVTIEV